MLFPQPCLLQHSAMLIQFYSLQPLMFLLPTLIASYTPVSAAAARAAPNNVGLSMLLLPLLLHPILQPLPPLPIMLLLCRCCCCCCFTCCCCCCPPCCHHSRSFLDAVAASPYMLLSILLIYWLGRSCSCVGICYLHRCSCCCIS